ncbi:MAG: XrtN system VIT domain-containing protein, partial [Bacteroidota bacterium]
QSNIQETIAEQNIKFSNRLPDAIYLAQKLPDDALTEEILMSTYKAQRFWGSGFMFDNEGDSRYHNPLSTLALGMFGDVGIDRNTVENILNIRRDYRHATTRKLWTGISLSTSAVSTNIRLFPEYRLAYHEKTMRIHNDPSKDNRDAWFTSSTQEALYTFHVPDGSIVTSLSLWINGREEKSRLTTNQRADSAYTRIVGTERRDPAIVHWREGNTITVNIFPCTPAEDRQFKIGFTTPLKLVANALQLENVWFEGPDAKQAMEVTQILPGNNTKLTGDLPEDFVLQADGNYIHQGDYLPYWQINLLKPALSKTAFYFGGYKYTVQEPAPQLLKLDVKEVFLDITSEWNRKEYDNLLHSMGGKQVYAWLPEKTLITAENKDRIWESSSENKFSVPFIYDIEKPAQSVIVTKTPHHSPILGDLKNSDVSDRFTSYLANNHVPLQVINIGQELSPFWRSLRELRLVNYNALPLQQAIKKINSGQLEHYHEDTTVTVLPDSHMALTKTAADSSEANSTAPDHLMRIFAYNDLLRKIGPVYFEKDKYENELFREAEEAYVVSPITSMIVLESLADYERMGIHKNTNTLGNASVLGGGAVPEPHEWLLIGLVAFFILRHIVKQKRLAVPHL